VAFQNPESEEGRPLDLLACEQARIGPRGRRQEALFISFVITGVILVYVVRVCTQSRVYVQDGETGLLPLHTEKRSYIR
jgi:hypothetical protein